MMQVKAAILSGDHSFKITKLIYNSSNKAFEGLYTMMNGEGQVVAWWLVQSSNFDQIKPNLLKLAKRLELSSRGSDPKV